MSVYRSVHFPVALIGFNVLNGEKGYKPCGTARIVFRNVSVPDLRDKMNHLRILEQQELSL